MGQVLKAGDGLEFIALDILLLAAGETYEIQTGEREHALVILGGRCSVTGPGFEFSGVGARRHVFDGKPHTVYLPAGIHASVRGEGVVEIAVCTAPGSKARPAVHIPPEQVKEKSIGRDQFTRKAHIFLDETVQADHLFIGEAYVPPGNWASFPPHRHDFDRLPDEVDMEELYFFRFDPEGGFGLQRIYNDSRSIDAAVPVVHNDAALLPEGYHPVVNAPGYAMYYLWIMAGKTRRFLSSLDPAHRWIVK
jgi:5-deoxy-glucuronate isomerase